MSDQRLNRAPEHHPRALHSAPFRLLWLSMVGANGGRWAFTMMASWLAYSLTHSPSWVGLTMFALQIPFIVVSPLTGVLADRVARNLLLLAALALSAGAALAAMVLMAAHLLTPLALVMLAFILGIGGTVQSTAQNALVPMAVPAGSLFEAFALQGTARQGAEFFGPAVVSPVLALFGATAALASVAALFLLGMVPVVWLGGAGQRAATTARASVRGDLGMLLDGVRYVRHKELLLPTLLLVATHCLLTMAYMGILPALAVGAGIHGSAGYGGLMTTAGLGAVAGTLLVATAGRRAHPGHLLWLVSILSGAGMAALGLARGVLGLEAAAFLAGGATASFMALASARIQASTAEVMRGRVTSIYLLLAGGAMAVANWAYGALATVVAVRAIPIAAGLVFIAIVAAGMAWWTPTRRIYLRPARTPALDVALASGAGAGAP